MTDISKYMTAGEATFYEWLKQNPKAQEATYEEIAKMYGKSERWVRSLIDALETKGYISKRPVSIHYLKLEIND